MWSRADGLAYATESDQEIYDILTAEFGDKASDTIVCLVYPAMLGAADI